MMVALADRAEVIVAEPAGAGSSRSVIGLAAAVPLPILALSEE